MRKQNCLGGFLALPLLMVPRFSLYAAEPTPTPTPAVTDSSNVISTDREMTASELNAILADAGELKVNDGVTLTITEDVTINKYGGLSFTGDGTIAVAAGVTVTISGSYTNYVYGNLTFSGDFVVSGCTLSIGSGYSLTNNGTITLTNNGEVSGTVAGNQPVTT